MSSGGSSILSFDFLSLGGLVGFLFLLVIVFGIVYRVGSVLVRHKHTDVRRELLDPVLRSGEVQSELYGFKPTRTIDSPQDRHHFNPDDRDSEPDGGSSLG